MQNCKMYSQLQDVTIFEELRDINLQLWEGKPELWDISSQFQEKVAIRFISWWKQTELKNVNSEFSGKRVCEM